MAKVRALTNRSRHKTLEGLLRQLNLGQSPQLAVES